MKIDPGELRHALDYEEAIPTGRDKGGGQVRTWVALWTGPAAVRPLTAKEIQYAGGAEAQVTHRITIRYRDGVRHGGRFRFHGTNRLLIVAGVTNWEERNAWLVITAIEKPDKPA